MGEMLAVEYHQIVSMSKINVMVVFHWWNIWPIILSVVPSHPSLELLLL